MLCLCVQSSRLRPNQTLVHVLNLSPLSDLSSKSLKRVTTELGISSRYEITSSPGPYLVNYIARLQVFKLYGNLAIEVSKRAHLKLLPFCWKEKHFHTLFEHADASPPPPPGTTDISGILACVIHGLSNGNCT